MDIHDGDLVLLYDSKVKGKPWKIETTLLGPYVVKYIWPSGAVKLRALQGKPFKKLVIGARIKKYHT